MSAFNEGDYDDFDEWNCRYHDYYPAHSQLDQEFRTSRLLVFAARSWTNRIDNLLRIETGQSRARWQVLFTIAFGDQPATMTEIAHRARVQWPTMMRVVQDMVREGLVERQDSPLDGRSKLLQLTPAGEAVIEKIQPILDRERAAVLAGLSKEDLRLCEKMLRKIFEASIQPYRSGRSD
jgi:MarR family transcriptional regulator, transcriptional regulator for hemolysin